MSINEVERLFAELDTIEARVHELRAALVAATKQRYLIEVLPGKWMTPTQARASFAGGPILSVDTARTLADALQRCADNLRESLEL